MRAGSNTSMESWCCYERKMHVRYTASVSPPLHVVFCGTPLFAVPALEALAGDPAFVIDYVVTQPDRPQGRRHIVTPSPVKVVAEQLGLHVWQPEKINLEAGSGHSALSSRSKGKRAGSCDFLVVVAYGQILSQDILDLPRIAPVNLHASLLPRWRGASPIEHAILAGDRETGITIQSMTEGLDAGPILAQRRMPIEPEDTATDLRERLAQLGAQLLLQTLKAPLRPVPQPSMGITVCRKLQRDSGLIDPTRMTAADIDRRVRALAREPGVHCRVDGFPLRILRAALHPSAEAIPLPCAQGTTVYLAEVQPPGKTGMTGDAWLRGHRRT